MSISRAFYAFYKELAKENCPHLRVSLNSSANHCPDCGNRVKLSWTQVRCSGCGSKRLPKKMIDGSVEPLHQYCRHCGSADVRVIKKDKVDAFELPYSVAIKEIDYSETAASSRREVPRFQQQYNNRFQQVRFHRSHSTRKANTAPSEPFAAEHIVEGTVIRKEYIG